MLIDDGGFGYNNNAAKVSYNSLANNSYGLYSGTPNVDGECNWWGSLKGPSHSSNPAGDGVPVSDNVDFRPWLTSGTDGNGMNPGFLPKANSCNGYEYIACQDKKNDKVTVCHNGKTKCIPQKSLQEHLDHGDQLGSCSSAEMKINNTVPEILMPEEFTLKNSPNPFRTTTQLEYTLPADSRVVIKVFDMLGREVSTLVNAERKAGTYVEKFDGSRLQTGVYYARMIASADGKQTIQTQKLVRAE